MLLEAWFYWERGLRLNIFKMYNPDKHRRRSIRLKDYDYSSDGLYFITICCHGRNHLFGHISVGVNSHLLGNNQSDSQSSRMILNLAGSIANRCWQNIPAHFPHVILHEYVIMPIHVHGIIELKNDVDQANVGVEDFQPLPQPTENRIRKNEYQKMIPRSVGSIIRGYKIGATKELRSELGYPTTINVWQSNYYEHIIRDEISFSNIRNYIINNPLKWKEDIFYT